MKNKKHLMLVKRRNCRESIAGPLVVSIIFAKRSKKLLRCHSIIKLAISYGGNSSIHAQIESSLYQASTWNLMSGNDIDLSIYEPRPSQRTFNAHKMSLIFIVLILLDGGSDH